MADLFANKDPQLGDPGMRHYVVVPSDTEDLPIRPRSIYINAGATVVIRDDTNEDISYTVTAGQILPFRPVRILATGTDASVIAWY